MARCVVVALLALAACARGASAQFEAATVELDATNELRQRGECHRQASVWRIIWTGCICEPCDRCFLDVARLRCELVEIDGEDSSDSAGSTSSSSGSGDDSVGLAQPVLDPDEWFLTDDEIAESRGGIPRDGLARASEDNVVTLFPATNRFFASLYSDLKALPDLEGVEVASDDQRPQVMLTGWSVDDIPFLPQKSGGKWNRTTFRHVFGRAIRRGADVRALVWANTLEFMQNTLLQNWMNSIDGPPTRARFLFDNRLPYPTASHHQKTVIIYPPQVVDNSTETDDEPAPQPAIPIAYVGGIDLTNDRWDTVFHNESWLRSRHGVANNYDGWVDASLRIQGRAANDVASNFCMRWNSPMPLLMGDPSTQVFTNPPVDATTNVSCRAFPSTTESPNEAAVVLTNSTSVASVQITRTFSCKVGYDFAPRGEISLLNSRLKAISKARNYIYIEDQYFVHVPPLRDALLAQLPKIKALVVVTQVPELSTTAVGYGKLFYDMIAPLRAQFPDKVRVFITRPELQLYVHTKVVLVDDVYLSVGSANWNRRSMTSDSEIAATLIDREHFDDDRDSIRVGVLAREFRLQKFREFTGREYDDLASMSLMEAVQAMDAAATDSAGIIKPVNVRRRTYFDVIPDELIDIADPFDQCE